ncbi:MULTISPECIES: dihydrodipicolinate synthase family protein [unclassified Roseitalea]|uniref:dihydrodipicolinate synthase family protein n=1 Tax=unclassified Roseitalea TaxID=2639107 RepID=UPI00273E7FCD|nr:MULTISPECIES: dihydrodipicolinate synthase family protein [unclassified Roseitalea]
MARHDIAQLDGVVPALITPFDRNGLFDPDRMRTCTRHLLGRGVTGLYLTGSTGEGFMMSPDERRLVVETVLEEVAGAVPVIVHVGAISTFHSVALARHAAQAGADAVSSVPPIYWPFTVEQIVRYYEDLTAATDLPMLVYNIPLAGHLGFDTIARLAAIDGVAGIKYTGSTQFDYTRMRAQFGPRFRIFSGADEMALSGLVYGAPGLIGSFYNVMPEVFIAMVAAVREGRLAEAQALQDKANAVIFFMLRQRTLAALKRIMAWQGADAGYCRAPLDDDFGPDDEAALREALKDMREARGLTGIDFLDAL